MNKHIGYINIDRFDPRRLNGANIATIELLDYLRSRENQVSVITFYTSGPDYRSVLEFHHNLSRRHTSHLNMSSIQTLLSTVDCYQEFLPTQVTHVSNSYQPVLKRIWALIKEKTIDHAISDGSDFYTVLGTWLADIPGSHLFHSSPNIHAYVGHDVFSRCLRNKTVFCASSFLQSRAKELLGIDALLWYPVFDLKRYEVRREVRITRTIGYYSSGAHKGDIIIKRIIKQKPEWVFIVVGVQHSYHSSEIPRNLQLWGYTEDYERFYQAIDVMLVPSIIEEGFARVILEAFANGIPVIANRVGGIPEAMGRSGIMIEIDPERDIDCEGIADQYIREIERLFSDEAYYEIMRKSALLRGQEYEEEQKRLSEENYRKYISQT